MGLLKYNIKRVISKKNKFAYLLFYSARFLPSPLFLIAHITLQCNKKCPWCYQKQDRFFSRYNEHMKIEEFERMLISGKRSLLKPHIHLYGGEPLSHPQFPLFLECCRKHGYSPTLSTNGANLTGYADDIISSSLTQINITVNDMLGSDGHVNPHNLPGLKYFLRSNKRRKIVNLNFVIDLENFKYIDKVIGYLRSEHKNDGISSFVCQHLMSNNGFKINGAPFEAGVLSQRIKQLKQERLGFELLFMPDIKPQDLDKFYFSDSPFINKCYVPWAGLSIYPDLTVSPGGSIMTCNKIIGDLSTQSINELWRGENLSSFRQNLLRGGLPKSCNRCCQKIYY